MSVNDVGMSFSPLQDGQNYNASNPNRMGPSQVQDAIRLLSFKLPSVVGASSPTSPQLMGGPTATGALLGNGFANLSLLRMVQGLFGIPSQGTPTTPTGGSPIPNIVLGGPSNGGAPSVGEPSVGAMPPGSSLPQYGGPGNAMGAGSALPQVPGLDRSGVGGGGGSVTFPKDWGLGVGTPGGWSGLV